MCVHRDVHLALAVSSPLRAHTAQLDHAVEVETAGEYGRLVVRTLHNAACSFPTMAQPARSEHDRQALGPRIRRAASVAHGSLGVGNGAKTVSRR